MPVDRATVRPGQFRKNSWSSCDHLGGWAAKELQQQLLYPKIYAEAAQKPLVETQHLAMLERGKRLD
jgi:hypothetical protein